MRATVGVRLETPGDGAFRLALFREVHGAVLARFDTALAETLLRQQLAGQTMTYAARYPAARAEIVEHLETSVGRMVIDYAANGFTLVDIALIAAFRRRGFGTELIKELARKAQVAGVPVNLNVAHGNPAQRLYARLGFTVVAASETDIAMRRIPGA